MVPTEFLLILRKGVSWFEFASFRPREVSYASAESARLCAKENRASGVTQNNTESRIIKKNAIIFPLIDKAFEPLFFIWYIWQSQWFKLIGHVSVSVLFSLMMRPLLLPPSCALWSLDEEDVAALPPGGVEEGANYGAVDGAAVAQQYRRNAPTLGTEQRWEWT